MGLEEKLPSGFLLTTVEKMANEALAMQRAITSLSLVVSKRIPSASSAARSCCVLTMLPL